MKIETVGVIGAGTMGNGIAQVCAMAGLKVVLIDINESAVRRGIETLEGSLSRLVKKEKMSQADGVAALARVTGSIDHGALAGADAVIEAATENLALKLRILKQIEDVVDADALIASNTSSISITQLAAALASPTRFVGMHFFNPVPMMSLVEVIGGLQTSQETLDRTLGLANAIGKSPILVKNAAGFAVNRILIPMINEAVFVLQEGLASAEDIDKSMVLGCNQPIGPLALADLIGLDTVLAIMQVLNEGFSDPKYRPAPLLKEMVAAGRLGRKRGHGFHSYAGSQR